VKRPFDPSPEVLAAIEALGRAERWSEAKAVIETRAALLLTDEAEQALTVWADQDQQAGYADHATAIRERLELVRRCRAEGVEAAVRDRLAADGPGLTPEVKRLVGRVLAGPETLPGGFSEAIAALRRALDLTSRDSHPELWAWLHRKLGDALSQVGGPDLGGRLQEALERYDQALEIYGRESHPREWAEVQMNRAATLANVPARDRSPCLEKALSTLEEALPLIDAHCPTSDRVGARLNLGGLHVDRLAGDHADNVERAIAHLRAALGLVRRESDPAGWARLATNLALALHSRQRGSAAGNLEEAAGLLDDAAAILSTHPARGLYATAENNLALVYSERIAGERYHNLEVALEHAEAALAAADPDLLPVEAVRARNTLGLILSGRLAGKRDENLSRAVEHLEAGLEVAQRHRLQHLLTGLLLNLGNAYQAFEEESEPRVRKAMALYENLLETGGAAMPRNDRMLILMSLGNAHRRLAGGAAQGSSRALECFATARELVPRDERPLDWYRVTVNLAVGHRDRSRTAGDEDARRAEELYREAATVLAGEPLPADAFRLYSGLGDLLADRGAWNDAADAYQSAMDAAGMLLDAAYSEPGRREEVQVRRHVFGRAVDALVEAGRPGEALLAAERGRSRLLREAFLASEAALGRLDAAGGLEVREARRRIRLLEEEMRQPPGAPHRRSDVELGRLLRDERRSLRALLESRSRDSGVAGAEAAELGEVLAAAPAGGALVVVARSRRRGIGFVVPAGCQAIDAAHVVVLDALDAAATFDLLFASGDEPGWMFAFSEHKTRRLAGGWPAYVERFCERLWPLVCAPLHAKLQELGVPPGAPVVLSPSAELTLLPLHAALRQVDGGRRYLLDDYQVTYAPSALAFRASRRRAAAARGDGGVLAVIDPTRDLAYAAAEGREVLKLFGARSALRLDGNAATREAVLDGMAGRRYLHFACHGFHQPWDALGSGLVLAGREALTVGDCLARPDLDGARLVTLSACETGMTGILDLPDEFVGLPAGLLQAGAAAVVGSLWAVDDRATAVLMRRFYENLLRREMTPPAALRAAQLWLRDDGSATWLDRVRTRQNRYASPYFWAGFSLTGW
jgi:tetratricopeptide (TPR) repeat protein